MDKEALPNGTARPRLDRLPHHLRQPSRSAAGSDGDQQRITVDDGGGGEIAKLGLVDDIDQQAVGFQSGSNIGGDVPIFDCDKGKPCTAIFLGDADSTRSFD